MYERYLVQEEDSLRGTPGISNQAKFIWSKIIFGGFQRLCSVK